MAVNINNRGYKAQKESTKIRKRQCASLPRETVQTDCDMPNKGKEAPMDVSAMSALIEAQRKQIEKLEKQLKYSQDKNLALNTLIDIAEEQGIKIRKKSGAKQ